MTKHSLVSFRLTRHLALGLGAVGLALGASGASVAATALVQPAGALSVQVPAVAVREQNVNAAGRIRVALPKTSVGVNGSVSVSNLPLNSAGRLQTQNGSGVQQFGTTQNGDPVNPGSTVDIVNVQGHGRFQGFDIGTSGPASANGYVLVLIDGHAVYNDGFSAPATTDGGGNGTSNSGCCGLGIPGVWGSVTTDGLGVYFLPPGGFVYHHSLVVLAGNYGSSSYGITGRVWYTTNG